ncbi:MAG: phosphoribosylanthranilate isomerase [Thermoplasmata archaeon]|nr:phosphoribosylanthranilate isomerase [Thermoplasmata archaeon]
MTFVKICGLKTAEQARVAREADAVGFVVSSPLSPRNLPNGSAATLARKVAPGQLAVAVTASRDAGALLRIAREVQPHAIQAPRDAPFLALQERYPALQLWAACRPAEVGAAPAEADMLVLDASTPEGYGGTGRRLDAQAAASAVREAKKPVLLAGGLTPQNVAEAIRDVKPFGVDVSSGVETDQRKDPHKIVAFIQEAKRA